jgi:plastocyanin
VSRRTLVLTVFVAAIAVMSIAVGCGEDTDTSAGVELSDKTFELWTGKGSVVVAARDNAFTPPYVEVSRGTVVTFQNEGRNPHNVVPVDDGSFLRVDSDEFRSGATVTRTFDEVGDHPFYCSLHGTTTKGMVGAIRVVE